ncbi:hypothetical protein GGX14DRAFT_588031 [Mycena pura]|uniref:Uncharacterized protein n=1 Tax=Mycena pura TaxID=153505 RepID=A0AAD6USQ2_9AGAR|nr:hypothetical protein GGX14DRAFT_588031 [Mycena pura]
MSIEKLMKPELTREDGSVHRYGKRPLEANEVLGKEDRGRDGGEDSGPATMNSMRNDSRTYFRQNLTDSAHARHGGQEQDARSSVAHAYRCRALPVRFPPDARCHPFTGPCFLPLATHFSQTVRCTVLAARSSPHPPSAGNWHLPAPSPARLMPVTIRARVEQPPALLLAVHWSLAVACFLLHRALSLTTTPAPSYLPSAACSLLPPWSLLAKTRPPLRKRAWCYV